MGNDRGQYGPPRIGAGPGGGPRRPLVGADPGQPSGRSIAPWMIGGVGLAVVGLAVVGTYATKRPRLSAHEKEVRAWEAEFPGLPWYMDQVKDSRQLDMWERARDYWEKKH
jgi:hypothetical protein